MPALSAILLVDDDPTANFIHRRLLGQLNASREILEAHNGQQALDLLAAHCKKGSQTCPALVLLDVSMPVMNGFEFLEAFAHLTLGNRQAIVVVVLSSSQLEEDIARAQQLPVAEFVHKPLTREKMAELLLNYFDFASDN